MIKIENLTKVYKTGIMEFQALRSITIEVPEGEYAAIMVPSGSGKSTFMNIH